MSVATKRFEYLPRWTKREVIESSGRDPLGLSRVSDALTSYLLPGIISTTERARYYSFYPWAVRKAQQTCGSMPFQQALMQLDAAFALCSALAKSGADLSMVGKLQVEPRVPQLKSAGAINTSFRVLPSNEFGPLDQYYATCLQELHLIEPSDDSDRWRITDTGAVIADTFDSIASQTPYVRRNCNEVADVTDEVLNESAPSFSLDGLRRGEAKGERALLVQQFFSVDHDVQGKDLARRHTLGQLLHVLKASKRIQRGAEDFPLLFSPHYFDLVFYEGRNFTAYKPRDEWRNIRGLWRQFCAHQYLTIALENFLTAILDSLSPHVEGLSEDELVRATFSDDVVLELEAFAKERCNTPAALLRALNIDDVPDTERCRVNRNAWRPEGGPNEWLVLCEQAEKTLGRTSTAILLIALLYGKWRNTDDEQWNAVALEAGAELWLGTFLSEIDVWLDAPLSWRDAIKRLLAFVYARHEQVMFQKRKLEACWVSLNNGRYFKEQSLQPRFRSARHSNAIRILYDLALVEWDEANDSWRISDSGETLLRELAER